MQNAYQGMPVANEHGRIGTVVGVENDPATGATGLVVEHQDGSHQTLTSEMFTVQDDTVYLHRSATGNAAGSAPFAGTRSSTLEPSAGVMEVADNEEVRIPIVREEAVITTRKVHRGGVRVHKLVNERTETFEHPTAHDHVEVERIAIGRVIDEQDVPQVREEGDTLIIPVLEEVLVVEKRLVLKEELRITKRRTEETERIEVVLREEEIQIEQIGNTSLSTDPSAAM